MSKKKHNKTVDPMVIDGLDLLRSDALGHGALKSTGCGIHKDKRRRRLGKRGEHKIAIQSFDTE
jgi:hypothetical protein